MKITLFTGNNIRHNYLINLLSTVSDEVYVVQECSTLFTGKVPDYYPASKLMEEYFEKVKNAQLKLFGNNYVNKLSKNIKTLPVVYGDLNKFSLSELNDFLKSDIYIVFGSSYIKSELIYFLIEKKTINIHMGVSPYYRGTDCNFWALYDDNPHLVGATIHMLSKGLDSGPMLYHAVSNIKTNPFEYTMSTVKSAFHSIAQRINDRSIFNLKPELQLKEKEIRYSKKTDFTEKIINQYNKKKVNLNSKKIDKTLLKDPFILEN